MRETKEMYLCPYCGDDKGDESNNFCCFECHCDWVTVCAECECAVEDCECDKTLENN